MKKSALFLLFSLCFATFNLNAQESTPVTKEIDKTTLGMGVGLDFGGFGANFLIYPVRNFGLFAGAGYALAGFGSNAGAKIRLISDKPESKLSPYAIAMYGYNAAIAVSNAKEYNKLFYGPSIGIGLDYRSRPEKKGYWSIALLLPFRSSEVDTYMDDLKQNHGVTFSNGLFPVGVSFGYRFILN
jgi:hypothetical protein